MHMVRVNEMRERKKGGPDRGEQYKGREGERVSEGGGALLGMCYCPPVSIFLNDVYIWSRREVN